MSFTHTNEQNTRIRSLSSTYDTSVPPVIRGEAVRAALRSDRGICIDFTSSLLTPKGDNDDSRDLLLNVACVKIQGGGTFDFLNGKLTETFEPPPPPPQPSVDGISSGSKKEGCLLTSKGRVIDKLTVLATDKEEAFVITSPGHDGSRLYQRLDPFVFPMDGVTLTDMCPDDDNAKQRKERTKIFTLACTNLKNVQGVLHKFVLPPLLSKGADPDSLLPLHDGECKRFTTFNPVTRSSVDVIIMEHTFLPKCACHGYTFIMTEPVDEIPVGKMLAEQIWDVLVDEDNEEGPVGIGSLEYESLRIECGVPGYGTEMVGDGNKKKKKDNANKQQVSTNSLSGASPHELHMQSLIDLTKGCYQGQEGVASILKNKRGPPRALYSLFIPDDSNIYQGQDSTEYSGVTLENLTRHAVAGDVVYALGSNESLKVGVVTSVDENGGCGGTETMALVLAGRADSILKRMKELDLELVQDPIFEEEDSSSSFGSGIIQPPPIDPLDGLEVVIGGTYTIGVLRVIPTRKFLQGRNMYEEQVPDFLDDFDGSVMGYIPDPERLEQKEKQEKRKKEAQASSQSPDDFWADVDVTSSSDVLRGWESVSSSSAENEENMSAIDQNAGDTDKEDEDELVQLTKEAQKAEEEARAAEEEARRKAEKMELLKQRAQEVMERRKQQQQKQKGQKENDNEEDEEAKKKKEAELKEKKRKEEKMEMLRRKAEEVMARRKKND